MWLAASSGAVCAGWPSDGARQDELQDEVQDDGAQVDAAQVEPQDEDALEVQPFATEADLQDEPELPVIDREPFDRLHFDDEDYPVLDVHPLELEGVDSNQPIDPGGKQGRLVFTIPEYPGRTFATPWSSLTKIERYSDLVLAEARQAMEAKDLNTAFRTLIYLSGQPDLGRTAELGKMLDECLYLDGAGNLESGNFATALAAFEGLFERNPRYRTGGAGTVLDNIINCYQQFVQKEFDEGDFQAVRDLVADMRVAYGERVDPIAAQWESRMKQRAMDQLQEVQTAVAAKQALDSHVAVRQVLYTMPDLPEATKTFNDVVRQFPVILVGVTQFSGGGDPQRIDHWAARRIGRLVKRTIMEFQKPGDDGGSYLFPSGRFQQIDELGLKFRFTIAPGNRPGVPELTAYELSNRLADLADPDSPDYYIPWARMIVGIEIRDAQSVIIRLRYPHVRPESLIPLAYFAEDDPRREDWYGLYRPEESAGESTVYQFNDRYQRPGGQLPMVVERLFPDSSQAADALIRGEIDILDRLHPADLARLRRDPLIGVAPYLIPMVHMLIPNPRNEFMQSDNFRRALQFGINRDLIIRESLTFGRDINGFEVVSGPFPPGTDTADQLAYAYNFDVKPRRFDIQLAMVLVQQFIVTRQRILEAEEGSKVDVEIPEIVLAHPDSDVIATACQTIAQQWRTVGIPVALRRLPPGVMFPEDGEYDVLYVEVQIQEPLVDAYRIFGRGGMVQITDPTIEQALRQLDSAYSWAEVSKSLRRVHRQAYSNLTILPLWQTVEHFAWRKNVYNIGDRLTHLYENVDQWQIDGLNLPDPSASAQSQ